MSPTTTPVRTLDDIAGKDGIFAIIAMDQRNTLRRMFTAVGITATDADLRQSKADVARVLSPAASGILFDPTYGVPAVMETGALHPDCGLLVASEPPERGVFDGEPGPTATPNWMRVGCWTRAATPTSSSPSCGRTARRPAGVSPTSWRSASRRSVRSSTTAAPWASRP